MTHADKFNNKITVLLLITLTLVVSVFTGCRSQIPAEYQEFFELSPNQQNEEMRRLPLDKQIDYYLAGVTYRHPPMLGLAENIARHGREAIPFLLQRLREERDERQQVYIMYVFKHMHQREYHNLSNEMEVIELLRTVTANMRDSDYKDRGEETLRVIVEGRATSPEEELDRVERELRGNRNN